jgi:hypothetical protein
MSGHACASPERGNLQAEVAVEAAVPTRRLSVLELVNGKSLFSAMARSVMAAASSPPRAERRRAVKPAAALSYLRVALCMLVLKLVLKAMPVGSAQMASTWKVVSLPLALFIETYHSSGKSPSDELIADELMLTSVLSDGVTTPPPVTTIPTGQSTT